MTTPFSTNPRKRRRISTRADLEALSVEDQEDRVLAADVVAAMRKESWSLTEATRDTNASPELVQRWASDALMQTEDGEFFALDTDDLAFLMRLVSTEGVVEVLVRGSHTRSLIGSHHSAVGRSLFDGNRARLAEFAQYRIGAYRFESDLDRLVELWRRGQLDYLEIYSVTH
jgi:hypothetical protein